MKKFVLIASVFIGTIAYGLPVGNPSEASLYYHELTGDGLCVNYDIIALGIGFYGDYVFNRHLKTIHDHDIECSQLFTNAAYLVVSFFERADTFATLGATNFFIHTNLSAFNAIDPGPRFDLDTKTNFSWSIGERITLWECGKATLGIVGQYFACRPDIKRLYIAAGAVSYPDHLSTKYEEWQVGLGVSYRIWDILPYAAVKWSCARWKLGNRRTIIENNVNTFLFDLENEKSWGYAIGATISRLHCDRIAVTVEGRFGDEKAVYVNGQMRF